MVDRTIPSADGRPAGTVETPLPPSAFRRISWGAVIAGAVIAIAIHFLLSLLGVGIGLSTVDPAGSPEAESLGIGAGIWWVISSIISIIVGGYVAARLEGLPSRGDGIIHGVLVWAVTLLVMVWLLASAAGGLIGGAFNLVGNTVSAAGQGIAAAVPAVADATGLSPEQLDRHAEELLSPGGTAPSDPQAARRDLVAALTVMATQSGPQAEEARNRAVTIISQQANISRQEADQRITRVEQQVRQTTQNVEEAAEDTAHDAADVASSGSLWAFLALLLGALAGIVGGAMGTRHSVPVVATPAQ